MEAKQQQLAAFQDQQADNPQQQDEYPLRTREKQPQQAGYQTPQANYTPQQERSQPSQAGYPSQQATFSLPQPSYLPQQESYPSQQAGYPPQHEATDTGVIYQQPSPPNTVGVEFGKSPVRTVCPHCRVTVVSTTRQVAGDTACICCLVLCCFGCTAGCCLLPFYLDECLDVEHACPLCKNKIGVYKQPL